MTKQEAIDLLNTLTVIECEIENDCCFEVMVAMDSETREVLRKLGKTDEWIDLNKHIGIGMSEREGMFNLTLLAWDYAKWFCEERGFLLEEPDY
ncbi:hypothetical protein [Brevibacillus brevis]|uniref:hypothetical protein n=1 Tax=Brevibacillus brevis TaxID=1393 RepID=UPI0007D8BDB5|nr:hypothetical protein [Brevibacillus brevis]